MRYHGGTLTVIFRDSRNRACPDSRSAGQRLTGAQIEPAPIRRFFEKLELKILLADPLRGLSVGCALIAVMVAPC